MEMKIDIAFLLKAVKDCEKIFLYHEERQRTQRYFSRFFTVGADGESIVIDFPFVDGYTHHHLSAGDPISVVFHSAGFRFRFQSAVMETIYLTLDGGASIPALRVRWPDEILDGNRRSLYRIAVHLDTLVNVRYCVLETSARNKAFEGVESLMIDISENGMALRMNRPINFEVNDKLQLFFHIEPGDGEPVEINGTVRNIRQFPGSDIYICGIEFTPGKSAAHKRSLRLITCFIMSRKQEDVSFFTVNQVVSKNEFVRKIAENEITEELLQMLFSRQLSLTEEEYLESLVYVLKLEKYRTRAYTMLESIEIPVKEEYIRRIDANHRVAYYILLEALEKNYLQVIAGLVHNAFLPVQFLTEIAMKGNRQMLKALLTNKIKLMAYPDVMERMEENPAADTAIKEKIKEIRGNYLDDGQNEQAGESIPEEHVVPQVTDEMKDTRKETGEDKGTEKRTKALELLRYINGLSLQKRIKLAFTGSKSERIILARDPNKYVVLAAAEGPNITEEEIISILKDRRMHTAVVESIATGSHWLANREICMLLLQHPNLPTVKASLVVHQLDLKSLDTLIKDPATSPVIRNLARYVGKEKITLTAPRSSP